MKLNEYLNNKFIIYISYNINSKPKVISIKKNIIYLFIFIFLILIGLSIFIITRFINYTDTIKNNLILENKLEHFSKELIKNRNYLSEINNITTELKNILNIENNTKSNISSISIGGPQLIDQIISNKIQNFDQKIIFTIEEFDTISNIIDKEIKSQLKESKKIFNYIYIKQNKENARPSIWPTIEGYISSNYGYRIHPIHGTTFFHKGIDIANPVGTPVIATADGTIKYANWLGGYGKLIIIDHGYGYTTFYSHLKDIFVKKNQKVKKGQKIGSIGNTGLSTAPHLHYEVKFNKKNKNPMEYIPK